MTRTAATVNVVTKCHAVSLGVAIIPGQGQQCRYGHEGVEDDQDRSKKTRVFGPVFHIKITVAALISEPVLVAGA